MDVAGREKAREGEIEKERGRERQGEREIPHFRKQAIQNRPAG